MKIFYGAGLNENQFPHPGEAATGSYNFDLKKDSSYLFPRMPFDKLGTATNGGDIRGILQLIKRDDTETTLIQSGSEVYLWDGGATFTSKTTLNTAVSKLRDTFWPLGDYLVITDLNKHTPVSKWDGSTWGTLTTGLGASLFAKYGIVHKGRMWLFNVKTTTDTPHLMVASAFEDPTSYNTTNRAVTTTFTTGSEAFYMLTPDLKAINGVDIFHGDLVISTEKGRMYKLTGSDARDFKWIDFYAKSNAVGTEAMVNGGNDIYYMRSGGNIESLSSTQQYGDVTADDLSRWIPDQVANLSDSIAVYDQSNQKVLWFTGTKVLVLYKDLLIGGCVIDEQGQKARLSPWSVYRTSHASGFSTSAARYIRRPGSSTYSVYFGDTAGTIYDLNGSGTGDAGNTNITGVRGTRSLSYIENAPSGIADYRKKNMEGVVRYQQTEECAIAFSVDWADEFNTSTADITLNGADGSPDNGGYFGGDFYFGGSVYFGGVPNQVGKKAKKQFSMVGHSDVLTTEISWTNNARFHIDNVELM